MIPATAVEAAARAYCADLGQLGHPQWNDLSETGREIRLEVMRIALEAAAPHMLAEAWEQGCREGLSMNPGWDDVALSANPYRGDAQ